MDHDIVRLMLAFRRPNGPDELTPEDAAALSRHLAGCSACAAVARQQTAFDTVVQTAMTSVPVPSGLRDRVLTAARAHRGAELRRQAFRSAAGIAAALVASVLVFGVYWACRPKVDTTAHIAFEDAEAENPERAVRSWLASRGLPPDLPYEFDYQYYVAHGEEEVAGRNAPVITFVTWQPNQPRPDKARVYILSETRFDLSSPRMKNAAGSFASAEVLSGRGVAYLIVYTTPDLIPFLKPRPPVG